MYQTILVYLDDPAKADSTLPQIERLANRFDSNVILTQVVMSEHSWANPWVAPLEDAAPMLDAEAMLARYRGRLVEQGVGTHVSVLPGYDSVADTIVAHARAHRIDLIVMPRQLNQGLLGWSAEGVTEQVIRSAPCDVLVIREELFDNW